MMNNIMKAKEYEGLFLRWLVQVVIYNELQQYVKLFY